GDPTIGCIPYGMHPNLKNIFYRVIFPTGMENTELDSLPRKGWAVEGLTAPPFRVTPPMEGNLQILYH
ncbi:MAG: hypothetical protein LBE91_08910, partial [Tannerella sp.]|nr:hypothetical protein [Tannerella sp.]